MNTLFSCLCTLEEDFNFYPRWRPPFISQLIDQDRCHLNGLALEHGIPRFVTVLGLTDEPAGWRSNKKNGGAILDVPSGEIISNGLCMPHSPRIHQGKLWVLNSGCGELAMVDMRSGRLDTVATLPGYTRGLAFHGNYAFIGLSRIRETNVFGGLPIGEHPERLHCGLAIVDITSGRTVATLRFKSGVEELFAVEILPGLLNPKISGPSPVAGEDNEIWIVPPLQSQTMSPRVAIGAASVRPVSDAPLSTDPTAPRSVPSHTSEVCLSNADASQLAGNNHEALEWLKRAVIIDPNSVAAWNRLGNLHQDLNDKTEAMACYRKAILADPSFAPAHQNLGVLHEANNEPIRALHHFERAQDSSPNAMNLMLAGKVLPIIYESKSQIAYWRQRLVACIDGLVEQRITIDTNDSLIPTSFHFAYQGENDRHLMEQLAKVYRGVDLCDSSREIRSRPRSKRIRVGFVSAYFCQHTIGLLNLGLIENLSRDRFEVFVIALRHHTDHYADRFRVAADHYVEVSRSPAQARKAI
ncbi:MAG: TIGR03032 family protein, partial [Pirellula sp.]